MQAGGLESRRGRQATKGMKREEVVKEMGSDGQTILFRQPPSDVWRLRSNWLVAEGSEVKESQEKRSAYNKVERMWQPVKHQSLGAG